MKSQRWPQQGYSCTCFYLVVGTQAHFQKSENLQPSLRVFTPRQCKIRPLIKLDMIQDGTSTIISSISRTKPKIKKKMRNYEIEDIYFSIIIWNMELFEVQKPQIEDARKHLAPLGSGKDRKIEIFDISNVFISYNFFK